ILSLIDVDLTSCCPRSCVDRDRRVLGAVVGLSDGDTNALDLSEDTMVVDALIVPRMHTEPGDARVPVETLGGVTHHVFNEDRIVVRLHSEPPLINALH